MRMLCSKTLWSLIGVITIALLAHLYAFQSMPVTNSTDGFDKSELSLSDQHLIRDAEYIERQLDNCVVQNEEQQDCKQTILILNHYLAKLDRQCLTNNLIACHYLNVFTH